MVAAYGARKNAFYANKMGNRLLNFPHIDDFR